MKKAPVLLAIGFVLITFFRVKQFLDEGLDLGWLGISFAIALTCAVYSAAYFTQFKETKNWAIVSLVVFGALDLWFNELEMIRSLSPEKLIVEGSAFLALNSTQITSAMHISALIYGVAPTLCSALLGFLQGDVEKVASLNKRGWIAQLWAANVALWKREIQATAAKRFGSRGFAELGYGNSGNLLPDAEDADVITANAGKIRWEDLKVADKEEIAAFNTRQIVAKWQVSPRTARNWKSRVESGG